MPVRLVVIGLLALAYILGSHWLMTSAPPSPWNAVALLTPMLAAIALSTWQARQFGRSACALLSIAALALQAARGVQIPAPELYLCQHVGINVMLALWFGSTLRRGAQSLITGMAERVHGHLTPDMVVYTRNVTRAWVVYFVLMAAASLAVFYAASFDTWARFSNLLTPVALGLMFGGERLLRYRLHPEFERSSMRDAIRAYMQSSRATAPVAQRDPLA